MPKIRVAKDGSVWYSPRSGRKAGIGVLYPDKNKITLAAMEGFHLFEEALESDCEIRAVIVSEPVKSAVAAHVRGLKRTRVMAVRDSIECPCRMK